MMEMKFLEDKYKSVSQSKFIALSFLENIFCRLQNKNQSF